jgi:hypothetical protein
MSGGESGGESRVAAYRKRAEELRAVAALLRDPKSRELILNTADDYERMARAVDRVERRARSEDEST